MVKRWFMFIYIICVVFKWWFIVFHFVCNHWFPLHVLVWNYMSVELLADVQLKKSVGWLTPKSLGLNREPRWDGLRGKQISISENIEATWSRRFDIKCLTRLLCFFLGIDPPFEKNSSIPNTWAWVKHLTPHSFLVGHSGTLWMTRFLCEA